MVFEPREARAIDSTWRTMIRKAITWACRLYQQIWQELDKDIKIMSSEAIYIWGLVPTNQTESFLSCSLMALARYRTLLMFFTSVLMPSGSPGLCTDTLASTLNWPSEEKQLEDACMGRRHFRSVASRNKRKREVESDFHTRHVALTGAQGLQDELKLPDSCCSLLSTAHVRLHHQLH